MKTKTLFIAIMLCINLSIYSESTAIEPIDYEITQFHRNNAGKILFSNKPIIPGKEDPNQFKTVFKPGEPIYAIAYFKEKKTVDGYCNIELLINKNAFLEELIGSNKMGKNIREYIKIEYKNREEQSFRLIDIIPEPEHARKRIDIKGFIEIFKGLSPQKNHKFDITYLDAKGRINLNYKGFDASEIEKNNNAAYQSALDYETKNQKLPSRFFEKENPFTDPELSKENIKKMILESPKFSELVKEIIYIHISGNERDWYLQKNAKGIPIAKITKKNVDFIYVGKDDKCRYANYIQFIKEFEGGETYSKARFLDYGRITRICCENAKIK